MTFSSLISGTLPHHNKFSSRNGVKITRGINHHWAGTSGGDARLVDPNEAVSANYVLYSDGRLFGQVPEEYRAWTSGSWDADAPSITVEIQNSAGRWPGADDNDSRSWPISSRAMTTLIALWADVARRYGWGKITRSNIRGHREFASTACPGGYVWHRLEWIASEADAILNPKEQPKEAEEEEETMEGLYYLDGQTRYVKIFDSSSGFEFNTETTKPDNQVGGTNRLAAAWGIKAFWLTDKAGYDRMAESLRKVRKGE